MQNEMNKSYWGKALLIAYTAKSCCPRQHVSWILLWFHFICQRMYLCQVWTGQ